MNDPTDTALWDDFFVLETVGDLRRFSAQLDLSIPEQAALSYYISTWPEFAQSDDHAAFVPGINLSRDRSAVLYGKAPVIFEGTNQWSWKPHFSAQELIAKTKVLQNVVAGIRETNPGARMTLLLTPEKDYVISRFLLKEDRFSALDEAIAALRVEMEALDIALVYEQPFQGIDKFQTLADFEYKDSHLAGRNYVSVFGFVLASLGVSWPSVKEAFSLKRLPEFGDLATKFENGQATQVHALQPDVPQGDVTQTAGSESFADPLGQTWQDFANASPLVDQSACLLGDSHCSIYAQRKLTYLFANTFRETHFEWNPCGIRKKPDVSSYDNVLLEISSRFVV